MKNIIKKLSAIKISELISISIVVPILGFNLSLNTNISQIINPTPDPQITAINIHQNLRAISIEGDTECPDELLWIEDLEQEEIFQLTTDHEGGFILAADDTMLIAQPGSHKIIAFMGVTSSKDPILKSNEVNYYIDQDYNAGLDLSGDSQVIMTTYDSTRSEIAQLQKQYNQNYIGSSSNHPLSYEALSYKNTVFWITVFEYVIIALMLIFIPFAIIRRWRRKKARHESFWSLGKGIYFDQKH